MDGWKDDRSVDYSITAMVNNLKDKFEERLRSHFKTDLKTAIGYGNHRKDRESAFNQMSAIINDCLYTQAMYDMQKTNMSSGARSTTKLKKSDFFQDYCKNFKCHVGGPFITYNESEPGDYRRMMCSQMYSAPHTLDLMKREFVGTGKICGKSLKDIMKDAGEKWKK